MLLKPATIDDMFQHRLSPKRRGALGRAGQPHRCLLPRGTDPAMKVGHGLGRLLTLQDVDCWCGERTLTWFI